MTLLLASASSAPAAFIPIPGTQGLRYELTSSDVAFTLKVELMKSTPWEFGPTNEFFLPDFRLEGGGLWQITLAIFLRERSGLNGEDVFIFGTVEHTSHPEAEGRVGGSDPFAFSYVFDKTATTERLEVVPHIEGDPLRLFGLQQHGPPSHLDDRYEAAINGISSPTQIFSFTSTLTGEHFPAPPPNKQYEGKLDQVARSPYFDGVKCQIDHVDPPVNSIGVSAWCGIDNNMVGGQWMWIQGGWRKNRTAGIVPAKIYWEFTDEAGNYSIGHDIAPPNPETYQISRNGDNAEWTRGATVYKTHPWANFDAKNFCKAQYGTEMHDSPDDHTPGGVSSKNRFETIQVRRAGQAFQDAALAIDSDGATNGEHEVYSVATKNNNFRTWDTRD
jgi:hypothetical protein